MWQSRLVSRWPPDAPILRTYTENRLLNKQIQKPAIRKQVEWDLWCYRFLSGLAEKLFDMPSGFSLCVVHFEG